MSHQCIFLKIRGVLIICLSALLVIATGCGKNKSVVPASSGAGSSEGSSSSSASLIPSSSPDSTAGSSESVNSSSAASDNQSGNSKPVETASVQTQQTALNQTRAALTTKVPLMLPTSVPVEKGRYLTATTTSQTTNYKVNLYETKQPTKINSQAASKGTLLATVEGNKYKDTASAKEKIDEIGYLQVDVSDGEGLLDLGHSIKAMEEAGLGHQQLIWNEGRWCIWVDSPIDPAYKSKEYPDRVQLAKNVVAYLNNHMLPAPQKIGVIYISIWNHPTIGGTTIRWQDNQTVYQIDSADPMTALKTAVAMKLK